VGGQAEAETPASRTPRTRSIRTFCAKVIDRRTSVGDRYNVHPDAPGFLYLSRSSTGRRDGVVLAAVQHTHGGVLRPRRLGDALARFGKPGIFNTIGLAVTSTEFTQLLRVTGSRSAWTDAGVATNNIFVERLWWTVEHEWVYCVRRQTASNRAQSYRILQLYNRAASASGARVANTGRGLFRPARASRRTGA